MKAPDGTQTSGAYVAGFVILFGLGFVFGASGDILLMFAFIILGWVWIVVGETIVGDGGRRAQLEKETSERELRERSASTERARLRREITVHEAYTKEEDLDYAGAL